MSYHVEITQSPIIHTAVIRSSVKPEKLSQFVVAACGEVWSFFRLSNLPKPGRNIALYLNDGSVEVGVEVSQPITDNDRVQFSQLPASRVATTVHFGPYPQIHEAHAAIRKWCTEHEHALSNTSWEIYGHWDQSWNADPSKIRTDIFYQLQD